MQDKTKRSKPALVKPLRPGQLIEVDPVTMKPLDPDIELPEPYLSPVPPVPVAVPPVPSGPTIQFHRMADHDLALPSRGTAGAAGIDLSASASVALDPGQRALVGCGFAVAIPAGHCGMIRSRSGLAVKTGITALHGTIDADYRGEVGVLLFNNSNAKASVARGDRIAQLVIVPVEMLTPVEVEALDETERGTGGFGSTGS